MITPSVQRLPSLLSCFYAEPLCKVTNHPNPLIETPSVSCQNKPIYYLRLQPTAFTPRPPL